MRLFHAAGRRTRSGLSAVRGENARAVKNLDKDRRPYEMGTHQCVRLSLLNDKHAKCMHNNAYLSSWRPRAAAGLRRRRRICNPARGRSKCDLMNAIRWRHESCEASKSMCGFGFGKFRLGGRHEHGLPALSANWGTLQRTRVATEGDKKQFKQAGLLPMLDAEALAALEQLLHTDWTSAVVASVNWDSLRI
jgi:hypothetical protein